MANGTQLKKREDAEASIGQAREAVYARLGPAMQINDAAAAELRAGAQRLLGSKDERQYWYGQQAETALDRGDRRLAHFTITIAAIDSNGYLSPQARKYAEAIIAGKADAAANVSLTNELVKANASFQVNAQAAEIAALREHLGDVDPSIRQWPATRLDALEIRRQVLQKWAERAKTAEELEKGKPSFRDEYASLLAGIDRERRIASLSSMVSGQIVLVRQYARLASGNSNAADALKNSAKELEDAHFQLQMGGIKGAAESFGRAMEMKAAALIDYAPPITLSPLAAQTREKEGWAQLKGYIDAQARTFSDIAFGGAITETERAEKLKLDLERSYIVEYSIFGIPPAQRYAARQASIRTDAATGNIERAREEFRALVAAAKTDKFAADASLMIAGAAAFFIPVAGPWISGGIFSGVALDNIVSEYRQNGRASPQAWAMLGMNAIPALGVVKSLQVPLLVAGGGAIAWGGANTYALYDMATKAKDRYKRDEYLREAVLQTGLLFLPLALGVRKAGPMAARGAEEAAPRIARGARQLGGRAAAAIDDAKAHLANAVDNMMPPVQPPFALAMAGGAGMVPARIKVVRPGRRGEGTFAEAEGTGPASGERGGTRTMPALKITDELRGIFKSLGITDENEMVRLFVLLGGSKKAIADREMYFSLMRDEWGLGNAEAAAVLRGMPDIMAVADEAAFLKGLEFAVAREKFRPFGIDSDDVIRRGLERFGAGGMQERAEYTTQLEETGRLKPETRGLVFGALPELILMDMRDFVVNIQALETKRAMLDEHSLKRGGLPAELDYRRTPTILLREWNNLATAVDGLPPPTRVVAREQIIGRLTYMPQPMSKRDLWATLRWLGYGGPVRHGEWQWDRPPPNSRFARFLNPQMTTSEKSEYPKATVKQIIAQTWLQPDEFEWARQMALGKIKAAQRREFGVE